MEKNVPSASVAQAFARKVFPVPGGYRSRVSQGTVEYSYAIEENAFPRSSHIVEKLWVADRQDDSLLQCFFSTLQTSDILPLDVRLFSDDCALKTLC